MKSFGPFVRKLYPLAGLIELLGTGLAIGLGVVLGIDKEAGWLANRPVALRLLDFIGDYALILYGVAGLLILFGWATKKWGNPWVWDKIKFILDEYQDKAFFKEGNEPQDHHRVTLFKYHAKCVFKRHWSSSHWHLPWGETPLVSNYLVPVLRSGHISQNSSAIFHVPDDSDKSEGVAGMAWSSRKAVVLPELPNMNKNNPGITSRRRYAEVTNSSLSLVDFYIEKNRPMPRSIAAIPVDVKGKPWGVIVLDSRLANGVRHESVVNYQLTVALLGQLLEEA